MEFERVGKSWNPIGLYITSGNGEDDKPDCQLICYLHWFRLAIGLPAIVKPDQKKVFPKWDAATVARLGRDYYINYTKREYGFMSNDGHFSLFLGRQTDDSSTEQRWSCFLPWLQWRHVRHSVYGLNGEYICDAPKNNFASGVWIEYRDAAPKVTFKFKDFDGEEIEASTLIEEREWRFGEGWFKWLSVFRNKKIRRSLDIQFSKEVGRKKGSWKGGTMGHGIDMLPNELHADAFKRYCVEHELTLL